ncbi:MAG: deoxyribodipyrimidine photo-lyase [Arcticibacterium sp.]|jgi:deoxyribodipyrimidine photo-lyase
MNNKISIFWFRRDLRLEDNIGLYNALKGDYPVLPIFIFDDDIISELPENDARISFIYQSLNLLNETLGRKNTSLLVFKGTTSAVWGQLIEDYDIDTVYTNRDYEPYAKTRDKEIEVLLLKENVRFKSYKDQVIFEGHEVLKDDNSPYTVYTPYKNKWRSKFTLESLGSCFSENETNYFNQRTEFPNLEDLGFLTSDINVKEFKLGDLDNYQEERNIPYHDATSYLGPHLRFGTVSIRSIALKLHKNETFLNELVWREFFIQILYNFPKVVIANFKAKYDNITWRNNTEDFERWCEGNTGYPIVDAGMRQLNTTGYMHNRVRMITAGFLCKHLLIDWKWGEAYFAKKLLDYELASNNGNWQWSAGTGCDAAPYFRIFNPTEQVKKFDKELKYIKKWVPEFQSLTYPAPMVDHKFARERALSTYKIGLEA